MNWIIISPSSSGEEYIVLCELYQKTKSMHSTIMHIAFKNKNEFGDEHHN